MNANAIAIPKDHNAHRKKLLPQSAKSHHRENSFGCFFLKLIR